MFFILVMVGPISQLCGEPHPSAELRAWLSVSVRLRIWVQEGTEDGGTLGWAPGGMQRSPALNPFWRPKWHGVLLGGRLNSRANNVPKSLGLQSQVSRDGPPRTRLKVRVRS